MSRAPVPVVVLLTPNVFSRSGRVRGWGATCHMVYAEVPAGASPERFWSSSLGLLDTLGSGTWAAADTARGTAAEAVRDVESMAHLWGGEWRAFKVVGAVREMVRAGSRYLVAVAL